MTAKNTVQWIVISVLVVTSFAATGGALAWSGCTSQVTVQWGDTLSWIATQCGTTVEAIQAANPGLGWWVYAGQVLNMPSGYASSMPVSYPMQQGNTQYPAYGSTYAVRMGDTLGIIAASYRTTIYDILVVNPQIQNPSLIYPGQVINLPMGVSAPPPANYPPPAHPSYPPPHTDSSYSTLTIVYKNGMLIRNAPGGNFIQSAVNGSTWKYKPGSVFIDGKYKIWVEVRLNPPVKGCSTGWLLVTDQFGTHFTDPQIN